MKGVLLICAFILAFIVSVQAQEPQINKFLATQRGEIPTLLLNHDYIERTNFINYFQSSEFVDKLKSYSGDQKLDSIVTKEWSNDSYLFENSFKYEYEFKNDGKNVIMKILSWDSELDIWRKTFDMYYLFNSEDKLILTEFEMYFTATYKTYTKIEYSYSNNRLTKEAQYSKFEEDDLWLKDGQIDYYYDSNNWLIRVITDVWDEYFLTWVVGDKVDYVYDTKGNIIIEYGFNCEEYDGVWTARFRTENKFDGNNNLIESTEYVPSRVVGILELDTKLELAYNSNAAVISEILYEWDYDLLIWLEQEKDEYSQNETDKLLLITSYNWIENSNSWERKNKSEFFSTNMITDQDIMYRQNIDVYLPLFVFDSDVCDLIESYNWIGNEWVKSDITTYYFSPPTIVGINQLAETKVFIYPNPTTDYINIEVDNTLQALCLIRDITGRIISQCIIWQKESLNLLNYQSGIYFVELQQMGQRVFTGKIIKK